MDDSDFEDTEITLSDAFGNAVFIFIWSLKFYLFYIFLFIVFLLWFVIFVAIVIIIN